MSSDMTPIEMDNDQLLDSIIIATNMNLVTNELVENLANHSHDELMTIVDKLTPYRVAKLIYLLANNSL